MDIHAVTVLAAAESWNWPILQHIQQSGEQGVKFKALTPKLLSCFILESRAYRDSQIVDRFWLNFQMGHTNFQTNSEITLV
jgi:hypothetical protein